MATRRKTTTARQSPGAPPPGFHPEAPGILEGSEGPAFDMGQPPPSTVMGRPPPAPIVGPNVDLPPSSPPPSVESNTIAPPSPAPKTGKRTPRKKTADAGPPPLKVTGVETDIAPDLSHAHLKVFFSDGNFGPFNLYALLPEVYARAAAFGIEQKIRKARDPVATGKAIATGTWPEGRTRGLTTRFPLIVRAVARLTGVAEAEAYKTWQGLPDDGPNSKKSVRSDQRVKGAIAQIKAEEEQSGVDMSALFGGAG